MKQWLERLATSTTTGSSKSAKCCGKFGFSTCKFAIASKIGHPCLAHVATSALPKLLGHQVPEGDRCWDSRQPPGSSAQRGHKFLKKNNFTSIGPKQFFKHRVGLQRLNLGSQNECQGNRPAGMQYKRCGLRNVGKNFT